MTTSLTSRALVGAALGVALLAARPARAQQPAESGPKVGDMAPDFSLPATTRYGPLKENVTLAQYRGNTVVLAFFFKARTKG